ncbi:MAG: uracil-DNA glycosylase [Halobacteriovoraceae bacterium]|nr:uracil-DNA glycosylase [Halobacteriovoraceae bacterium]|tara:strand:+ start:519 stop:1175 length:657 start_codon:yes stop_codon:yes gene_type:complete
MLWKDLFKKEQEKEYFKSLEEFLSLEEKQYTVFPPHDQRFSAFELTPFKEVKVVIIGQDPYHGEGQAHGLSFSVPMGVKLPPSLKNIFKELETDLGCEGPTSGNLKGWAQQGVLLLNTVLTVRKSEAGSHQKKGWENFTDSVVANLNEQCEGLVFLLWGAPAQKKGKSIDRQRHLVLEAPHPSPLSSYRGFFGCKHFSKTNEYLIHQNKKPIDWCLFL